MDPSVENLLAGPFGEHMRALLGEEYPAFIDSFDKKRSRALKLNPRKLTPECFENLSPFPATPLPWINGGYQYPEDTRPSLCPLYQAGAYYLQDAGAMTPAAYFPVRPGDLCIDLCAAPGGKATAVSAALQGKGLLVANDISLPRARALLRNLEAFGSRNILVTNEETERLADRFGDIFDKVILDAPCSGEGMFRKDPSLAADWTIEKSQGLAKLQRSLLETAYRLCKKGGQILYSTCTYETAEDEEAIKALLLSHPDLSLVPIKMQDGPELAKKEEGILSEAKGFTPGEDDIGIRIYPHRLEAEGHFFVILAKQGEKEVLEIETVAIAEAQTEAQTEADTQTETQTKTKTERRKKGKAEKAGKKDKKRGKAEKAPALTPFTDFLSYLGSETIGGEPVDLSLVEQRGEKLYLLPSLLEKGRMGEAPSLFGISLAGLSFLRCGLYLGDLKKDRFEPSQPLALALLPGEASRTIDLPLSSPLLPAYLRGEAIQVEGRDPGWYLLTTEGLPLAFGKLTGTTFKNKIPASWRQS